MTRVELNPVEIRRLTPDDVKLLVVFSYTDDFPCLPMSEQQASRYCGGRISPEPIQQTYGLFVNDSLVSIMTATLSYEFPHSERPSGRVLQISGAFTKREYRHRGYATMLLSAIEEDARNLFKADYICCDSSADELYENFGYEKSTETRLWKRL